MESEAKYFLVGLVVLGLAALATIITIWLGDAGKGPGQVAYRINFKQHSLAGLQVNSFVTMRGIRVGNVQSMKILPDVKEGVEVIIVVDPNVPLRVSTQAVIERNLLTGLASIDLRYPLEDSAPLMPGPKFTEDEHVLANAPIIPEGRVKLDQITDSATDILGNMDEALADIRAVFSKENTKAVSEILQNTQKITGAFAENSDKFGNIPEQAHELIESVERLSNSATKAVDILSKDLQRFTETLRLSLASSSQNIRDIGKKVGATVERLDRPGAGILSPGAGAFGPGEKNDEG